MVRSLYFGSRVLELGMMSHPSWQFTVTLHCSLQLWVGSKSEKQLLLFMTIAAHYVMVCTEKATCPRIVSAQHCLQDYWSSSELPSRSPEVREHSWRYSVSDQHLGISQITVKNADSNSSLCFRFHSTHSSIMGFFHNVLLLCTHLQFTVLPIRIKSIKCICKAQKNVSAWQSPWVSF